MKNQTESLEHASVRQYCKAVRVPTIGANFLSLAEQAVKENHSHIRYLEALLAIETEERDRHAIDNRIREAQLPRMKTLEEFDFAQAPQIQAARIPYEVPPAALLPERLGAVLAVIYLVFNEGYAASHGETVVRADLCTEAIRLGRIVTELIADSSEARGLLALMLIQDSRRAARLKPDGEIALLEEQDRTRWNRAQIREGLTLVDAALAETPAGPYTIQAAIAAVHARATRAADTNWRAIEALYAHLMRTGPSPVIELNHAVAVAMASGPAGGLQLIEAIQAREDLDDYHLMWAARADLLRRLGRWAEAADSYRRALALVSAEPERRFIAQLHDDRQLPVRQIKFGQLLVVVPGGRNAQGVGDRV